MKSKYLVMVGVVILAVGSIVLFNGYKAEAPIVQKESSASNTTPTNTPASKEGRYLNYDENTLSQSDGTRILFFYAPWCPQCRKLEADIKSGSIPAGVTIFKVDYDSNQDLRRKYGVTIQTTLVKLDKNGGLDKKFVAYDEPTLQNLVDNLL